MVEVVTTEELKAYAVTVGSRLSMLASRVDALEQGPQPKPTGSLPVPRVITAEECREGMTVHAHYGDNEHRQLVKPGDWYTGTVEIDSGEFYLNQAFISRFDIIVLLAEAPQTGYAADDHQDAEITQFHNPWHKP